jgi:hypothetical protein
MKGKYFSKLLKTILIAIGILTIAKFIVKHNNQEAVYYLAIVLEVIAGVIIGVVIPDIDIIIPKLHHRSAITHSCLPILAFIALDLHTFNSGLALGVALHLSSDVQSKKWYGTALIKIPVFGSIGMLTPAWLLLQIILCLEIYFYLLSNIQQPYNIITCIVAFLCCLCYFYRTDDKPLFPLLSFSFCALLLYFFHSSQIINIVFNSHHRISIFGF